jgi:hypothetical protein
MERRHLRLIVRRDLHGKQSVRGPVVSIQRRVTTSHNDLA